MEVKQQPLVLYDKKYKILKNGDNLVVVIPAQDKKKVPDIGRIIEVDDLVAFLKNLVDKLLINMNTGGPHYDKASKTIKYLSDYMTEKEIEYIKTKVYGDKNKEALKEVDILKFQTEIQEKYFTPFFDKEPDKNMWSTESWRNYKKYIFSEVFKSNFNHFLNLDYTFIKKEKDIFESLDKVILDNSNLKFHTMNSINYSSCEQLTPNDNNTYLWRVTKEYKRLGITGDIINEIKVKSRDAAAPVAPVAPGVPALPVAPLPAVPYLIYWLPVILNYNTQKCEVVHVNAEGIFQISDNDVNNIVGVIAFDFATHRISDTKALIIDSIIPNSYYHYILKMVDKSLNEAMDKIFEKYSMSKFFDYKKI